MPNPLSVYDLSFLFSRRHPVHNPKVLTLGKSESFFLLFFFLHRKTLSRISWTKFVEIKVHKIYWKVATNQVNYKVTTNSRLMILRLLIVGCWSFQRWKKSSSDIISLTRGFMSTFHFFPAENVIKTLI